MRGLDSFPHVSLFSVSLSFPQAVEPAYCAFLVGNMRRVGRISHGPVLYYMPLLTALFMFLSWNILNQRYDICVGCLYHCKRVTANFRTFFFKFPVIFFLILILFLIIEEEEEEEIMFFAVPSAAVSGKGNFAIGGNASFLPSLQPNKGRKEVQL